MSLITDQYIKFFGKKPFNKQQRKFYQWKGLTSPRYPNRSNTPLRCSHSIRSDRTWKVVDMFDHLKLKIKEITLMFIRQEIVCKSA